MEFIKEWGLIAGLAGLALGVFLILFREIIRKNIFPKLSQKNSFVILILFMVFVWTISIYSITIYQSSEKGKEIPDSTELTVYVHGPKGKQEVIIKNNGQLVLDFGNDRRKVLIGENGRTNFGEIPEKFIGKEIGIGLEADGYELVNPSQTYTLDGNPIYLAVKKDNSLSKISGIIKNRDGSEFIEGATIFIDRDTSIKSNENGIFKIVLPERLTTENAVKGYSLTIKKDGYKIKTELYNPESGDIEIRLIRKK